jgi:hypothetical protein
VPETNDLIAIGVEIEYLRAENAKLRDLVAALERSRELHIARAEILREALSFAGGLTTEDGAGA